MIRTGRLGGQPCFSPHTNPRREILGSRSRFELSTVAPGQNSGGTPYRQLCPAYPSADRRCFELNRTGCPRAKGSAGTFQRGKFPNQNSIRKRVSKAQSEFCAVLRKTHGLQQAWINSRNQTTIATRAKHRQPMFFPGSCPVWIFRFGIELFLLPQREQFPHWSVLTSLQFAFALR